MPDYASPAAPSNGLNLSELHHHLLLVQVVGIEPGIQTVHGTTDAIRANVTVLDGPQAGELYEDTLIFPKVLQSQLRGRIGQLVLGRLTQGMKKPGQNPPWQLAEATAEDKALADEHMRKVATPTVESAAQPPF